MTLLGMSADLKTFDVDNAGYLLPNPPPEHLLEQENATNAENSYMNMNKDNKIYDQPVIKDEGYIEISNAKKKIPGRRNLAEAVRYSKSPGQNSEATSPKMEKCPQEEDYTEIFFKNHFSDREPIFNNKGSNPKLVSINVLLFVLILLLAVPVVYLFVVIQGQNRTLVIYEGKIKLLEEKLLTFATQMKNWEQGCCSNSSMNLHKFNESLETLAEITFSKIDVNGNMTNLDSRTALHIAAKEGQSDRVKFLIAHGANLEAKDLSGFTPLHLAALYRHEDVINLLLDEGAMINGVNYLGKTALFFAVRNDCLSCVKTLLERGADAYHKDSHSSIPLDFANQNHHKAIAEFIREYMEKHPLL